MQLWSQSTFVVIYREKQLCETHNNEISKGNKQVYVAHTDSGYSAAAHAHINVLGRCIISNWSIVCLQTDRQLKVHLCTEAEPTGLVSQVTAVSRFTDICLFNTIVILWWEQKSTHTALKVYMGSSSHLPL